MTTQDQTVRSIMKIIFSLLCVVLGYYLNPSVFLGEYYTPGQPYTAPHEDFAILSFRWIALCCGFVLFILGVAELLKLLFWSK